MAKEQTATRAAKKITPAPQPMMETKDGEKDADNLSASILRLIAESNLSDQQKMYALIEATSQLIILISENGSTDRHQVIIKQMTMLGSLTKHIAIRVGPTLGDDRS